MTAIRRRARLTAALALSFSLLSNLAVNASSTCPDEQSTKQVPNLELCKTLEPIVRRPSALPLNEYETKFGEYLGAMCHRNEDGGWKVDKRIRDTGPWTGTFANGKWTGQGFGTHAPVLIWYSPLMYEWLKANRAEDGTAPATAAPVPDGAMMIKEMYPYPAAACAGIDVMKLLPLSQASAVMVRDSKGSYDGWFWGWYGWGPNSGWSVDWPAKAGSPYPVMGFGQYCTNCHASAKDNSTFSALKNIKGEPGEPLVFLSQNFFLDPSWQSLQARIQSAGAKDTESAGKDPEYDPAFLEIFQSIGGMPVRDHMPVRDQIKMPSETYDSVWTKPGEPTAASQFVTSDQCLGCHSAGGTGLQYDMTQPGPDGKLINISPYGTWRGSPMGLAGRDPIFFAQLASETETFHKESPETIQNTCLGCHGIMGQRQHAIDNECKPFSRAMVDTIPSKAPIDPVSALANYGSLARDGISCASCHHMVLGKEDTAKYQHEQQNKCIPKQQQEANPGLTGFAATFTGNFLVGPPNELYGPFKEPKKKPMKHAMGVDPAHSQTITKPEMCGTCHTVHVPILHRGKTIGHAYEQTTYPEWAFSDYRTGDSVDGVLPYESGPQAQSCQACHMPNKDAYGNPYRSKIAAIQEYSNFPQSEHSLPPHEIDLPVRSGFGKHTLVGLNVYLLKMAWQFPDILGIRKTDPMLTSTGIDSIPTAENAMLDQAVNKTATVTVGDVRNENGALSARVTVINKVGHKFPSGVGFRRAFIEFSVLDVNNKVLWASGRTNEVGVLIDGEKNPKPIKGELWWNDDCTARPDADAGVHQPHYQEINRQDQVQIYQELVAAPPPDATDKTCGPHAKLKGPLTTSFLSICAKVKDNRLLPAGFLKLDDRIAISKALGADELMARESGPEEVGNDPDYVTGGRDSLVYRVPLSDIDGKPAAVQATLYYQPTPPFFLQDRFCTSKSVDTQRLYYLAGKLGLSGTQAQHWKLRVIGSGPVTVP
jgi:hypothetical protein